MKIGVFGLSGRLGRSWSGLATTEYKLVSLKATTSVHLSVSRLTVALDEAKVDCVVNLAAMTNLIECERNPDQAHQINSLFPHKLALACKNADIPFFHMSSDYVFGNGFSAPISEFADTSPISVYGKSKLEGERRVLDAGGSASVLRTSWLLGLQEPNFVGSVLGRMSRGESVRVVRDQVGSPTTFSMVSDLMSQVLGCKPPSNTILHLACSGEASWYEIALAIRDYFGLGDLVVPIASESYLGASLRPNFSALSNEKVTSIIGVKPSFWLDALHQELEPLRLRLSL